MRLGRTDEDREREEGESDVAGCDGEPSHEGAVFDLLLSRAEARDLAAVLLRNPFELFFRDLMGRALLLGRLAPAVLHGSALPGRKVLGKRAAEDVRLGVLVGVEARQSHDQAKDNRARERERQIVENEAPTQVAAVARLGQRSGGRLDAYAHPPYATSRRAVATEPATAAVAA